MTGLDVWGPMTIGDGDDDIRPNVMDSYQKFDSRQPTKKRQGKSDMSFMFSQPDKMPPR
jgi:hypothetical protein